MQSKYTTLLHILVVEVDFKHNELVEIFAAKLKPCLLWVGEWPCAQGPGRQDFLALDQLVRSFV